MVDQMPASIVSVRSTKGLMKFSEPFSERPRYHANDSSRDVLNLVEYEVEVLNGRALDEPPSLEREGLKLLHAPTAVTDFRDDAQTADIYAKEIIDLVTRETGADKVLLGGPGGLRFAENSPECGKRNNSRPARFIHNDVSEATAQNLAKYVLGEGDDLANYQTFAMFNIWRPFSPPPQNIPLAVLDGRTLEKGDLLAAEAVFDEVGKPDWSFEGYLVRHNPAQRWIYYPEMGAEDALMFTTFAYRDGEPFYNPHTGFDDPDCPADAPPRESIEMRAIAFYR